MICTTHFDVFKSSEEQLTHTEANYGTVVFFGLKETLQKMLTFYLLPSHCFSNNSTKNAPRNKNKDSFVFIKDRAV